MKVQRAFFFLEHQSTSFNGWIGNRREMSNGCKVILMLNNVAQEKNTVVYKA